MDKLKYALLARVHGRGKADVIESFLRSEEIDVVLVQDAVSHVTYVTSFAPVQIFVPKASIQRARNLLRTYTKLQDNSKEKPNMANKKKIEERLAAERRARQSRYIQIAGIVTLFIVLIAGFWAFSRNLKQPTAEEAAALTGQPTQAQSLVVEGQTACENFSAIPEAAQYPTEPPMGIDVTKQYFATVKMAKGGEFKIQLFPDKAPRTVNSFVFLACRGYFNGVTFHRVIEGFMAQGGDPTGTGTGGPGYEFVNEDSDLTFDKAGVVAMGNHGRDTNGSQFFITFVPYPSLNGNYTIFGQVIEGMEVVNAMTRRDPQENPTFEGDAMESVTITEE
jgi:cyclophilin family peptidyl-prolyl cis-trans isomerase